MDDEKNLSENTENIEKTAEKEQSVVSPWAARFFDEVAVSDVRLPENSSNEVRVDSSSEETNKAEKEPIAETAEKANDKEKDEEEKTEAPDGKSQRFSLNFMTLFIAFALVIIVTVFITFFVAKKMYSERNGIHAGTSVSFADKDVDVEKIAKFQDILDFIRNNYYKDYDINDMIEGAIEGMVESLDDPYGNYYAPGNMDSYTSFIEGSYTGLGFTSSASEKGLTVTEVVGGSPAEKAGIAVGDLVTHINEKEVSSLSSTEISSMLAVAGTEIKLKGVKADGNAFDIGVTVEKIIPTTVTYKELEEGIKYIGISQFISGTAEEFKKAVEKAAAEDATGLVIDLRNNPGGYANEATNIADIILPEGTIATSRDRNDKILTEVKSDKNEITVPVVLLVNERSASASELVTGAFRDFKKGEIVGVHTFGKALSQINKVYKTDGSGIVLTYSRYFTPSGECIDGVGIEPTVKVELSEEYKGVAPEKIPAESDLQLIKAIEIIKGKK